MSFQDNFFIWDRLTKEQQNRLISRVTQRNVKKGTVIHNGSMSCMGLVVIESGQLRAYKYSDEGKEITLYRMFEMDICLFSASCVLPNIQFDITIEAEKDSEVWTIPPNILKELMEESAPMANYLNQIMASNLSEIIWLMEQIMWKSFDKRLAAFLLEESHLEESNELKITHEKIANHLGTAREVVTRMLRYFQNEKIIRLTRGTVEILDSKILEAMQ